MTIEVSMPYPEPEFTSRDSLPEGVGIPAVVSSLAEYAADQGWAVRVQLSRGCKPHSVTARPLAVKTYAAVRMLRDGWGAYAVHDVANWDDVVMWGESLPPFSMGGVTDLRRFLAGPEACDARWFDGIRARVAGQATRAKQRAACNAGRHDGVEVLVLGAGYTCASCGNTWKADGEPWKARRKGTGEGR